MSAPQTDLVRILLAEDNPGDVRLVREALRVHEVRADLHVIEDGEKAVRFIQDLSTQPSDAPNLVLLDLNLPKTGGRDILKAIRDSACLECVPVVILSSSDSPEDRADTTALGATRYFRKATMLDEFLEIGAIAKELTSRK
jgi:chemotaxis family two-component system response regulator Rcp1